MNEKEEVPEYVYLDYDSETDIFKIGVNITEAEEEEVKKQYEEYLETKTDKEEAIDYDSFYNVLVHIGFYEMVLKTKEDYLKLLEVEIEDIKRKRDNYLLML